MWRKEGHPDVFSEFFDELWTDPDEKCGKAWTGEGEPRESPMIPDPRALPWPRNACMKSSEYTPLPPEGGRFTAGCRRRKKGPGPVRPPPSPASRYPIPSRDRTRSHSTPRPGPGKRGVEPGRFPKVPDDGCGPPAFREKRGDPACTVECRPVFGIRRGDAREPEGVDVEGEPAAADDVAVCRGRVLFREPHPDAVCPTGEECRVHLVQRDVDAGRAGCIQRPGRRHCHYLVFISLILSNWKFNTGYSYFP